jgi:hypothetical protein
MQPTRLGFSAIWTSFVGLMSRDAERKRSVFEAYDVCSEGPLGKRARAQILDFARAEFSEHSPAAFTTIELQNFNAQRWSDYAFEPYNHE